jgi:hypothetical protein
MDNLIGKANALATKHRFFHWPLEFPEIFSPVIANEVKQSQEKIASSQAPRNDKVGGFDVVLGNPPWERIKLQEQEFFATRDPEIANAPNKAAREKLIKELPEKNTALFNEFQNAKHDAESGSRFVREGDRFPLTAVGDVNTYALFAEHSRRIQNTDGRAGIIVPTGIGTDDTCKNFFGDLNKDKNLASLYDFENREKLFAAVDSRYKFCLFTMGSKPVNKTNFAFFLTNTEQLRDEMRRFSLTPEDIILINPNTRTTPVFRTKVDAELTKKIYRRVPVLVNERTGENPWGINFMRMFDMANDSHLFYREPANGRLPLYEAKMIWQYNHRFGTYEDVTDRYSTHLPTPSSKQYADPTYSVQAWYWIEEKIVKDILNDKWDREWLFGFRDVTNATNERTGIFSIIPVVGIGHKIPLIIVGGLINPILVTCLIGNTNSIVFDYVTRQKIGGTSLSYFILKQLPVIQPHQYSQNDIDFINTRVLELVYTANDIKPFAEDMGYDGPPFRWDEERRALLRAELDAYYAKLYGLDRDELRYILDPQDVYGPNFPGETFRVLKDKEIRQYGEYRTRRLVLEAWDRLFGRI